MYENFIIQLNNIKYLMTVVWWARKRSFNYSSDEFNSTNILARHRLIRSQKNCERILIHIVLTGLQLIPENSN